MKTENSLRSFRRKQRGSAIIEMLAGLLISGVTMLLIVWIASSFFTSRTSAQAVALAKRQEFDELGRVFYDSAVKAERSFPYTGRLLLNGVQYQDQALTLTKPLFQVTTLADFLSSSGLTLDQSAATAGMQGVVSLGEKVSHLTIAAQSVSGTTDTTVTVKFVGEGGPRVARYTFSRNGLPAPPLTSLEGQIRSTSDGAEVVLPNPLSHPSLKLSNPMVSLNSIFLHDKLALRRS